MQLLVNAELQLKKLKDQTELVDIRNNTFLIPKVYNDNSV